MTVPPPDPPDGNDPWQDLKDSPLWDKVQRYSKAKLQGAGKRIKVLEAENVALEQQLATFSQQSAEGFDQSVEVEKLQGSIEGYIEAVTANLPPDTQSMIPRSLPPSELLEWLGQNLSKLSAPGRTVQVHGGAGRSPGVDTRSTAEKRADIARESARRFLFGGKKR